MDCTVPAGAGAGSPVMGVAAANAASVVIGLVARRMSYVVAVPVEPSSPGAVQESVAVVDVVPVTASEVMAAGPVGSGAADVVPLGLFESALQFGTSSAVFIAK